MKLYYLIKLFFILYLFFMVPLTAKAKNQILANKIVNQYVRQKNTDEVYDISGGNLRPVSYGEAQKNNIWKSIKEVNELPAESYDTQRAYGAWRTRPDLQKEFPDFYGQSSPEKWSMKDWYEKYGKIEYADPTKNFFGVKTTGVDDWDNHISKLKFGYDWGTTGVGGYYRPDTNEITYNSKLSPEIKRALINHEIGHYLTKNSAEEQLNDLFGDAGQKYPLNLLVERAAVAYSNYKAGIIKDRKWIKYFKDLEEKNYKSSN